MIARTRTKSLKYKNWNIINIPENINNEIVKKDIESFLNRIVAFEIPTSYFCNLRCKYCYIHDYRYKNIKISVENIKNISKKIEELFPVFKNNKEFTISSWGAEPFCNLDTLEFIINYFSKYEEKFKFNTSTNGTIITEKAKNILDKIFKNNYAKSIQISLDGSKEIQDKFRPFTYDSDKHSSFDKVIEFIKYLKEIRKKYNINHSLFTLSGTLNISDKDFENDLLKATEYFINNSDFFEDYFIPIRYDWYSLNNDEILSKVIKAFKKQMQLIIDYIKKDKKPYHDFFVNKLFSLPTCKSPNSFQLCSAFNTQIGIDLNGDIFPCHAPFTQWEIKKDTKIGNIFDEVIDYKNFINCKNICFNVFQYKMLCKNCDIFKLTGGSICFHCFSENYSINEDYQVYNYYKCILYNELFYDWLTIACLIYENSYIFEILKNYKNKIEKLKLNINEINELRSKINKIKLKNMKFNINYNTLINNCKEAYFNKKRDLKFLNLRDEWYKYLLKKGI